MKILFNIFIGLDRFFMKTPMEVPDATNDTLKRHPGKDLWAQATGAALVCELTSDGRCAIL